MFNGKRIAALEKLVEELQGRVKGLESGSEITNFLDMETVYMESKICGVSFDRPIQRPRQIKLINAVKAILDHFGLQLRFQEGAPATPERLVLQKKPKGK